MSDKKRIEIGQRKVMVGNVVHQRGAVIETDDPTLMREYDGLVKAGYAKASTKALTSGYENKSNFDAASIVDGTVGDVTERLAGLDAAQLKAVAKAEAAGKDRAGVHSAIESASAALEGGGE